MLHLLVIGTGNAMRRDDGVGLRVARLLRGRAPPGVHIAESDGDLTRLLSDLAAAQGVFVVDAMTAGVAPGTVVRIGRETLPQASPPAGVSTHGIGVAAMIEMLQVLGLSPEVRIYGVQGVDFGWGEGLSVELEARVDAIADDILIDIAATLASA